MGSEPDTSDARARSEPTITALFARANPLGILDDDPVAALEWGCRTGDRLLGVDGAGISLIVDGQYQGALGVTDEVLKAVEAAQFDLAEGPCFEAVATRAPVLVPDFAGSITEVWPIFAAHIAVLRWGRSSRTPLSAGGDEDLGALAMYRRHPGPLSPEVFAAAVALADLAAIELACSPVADPVWSTSTETSGRRRAQRRKACGSMRSCTTRRCTTKPPGW